MKTAKAFMLCFAFLAVLDGCHVLAADAQVVVTEYNADSIQIYDGDSVPSRTIAGESTDLNQPKDVAVDDSYMYVVNTQDHTITVFGIDDSGDETPTRTIAGNRTGLYYPDAIAIDENYIYIANGDWNSITVFNIDDDGNVFPRRKIYGDNTELAGPYGIAVDGDYIYVANNHYGGSITVYNLGDNGNVSPQRKIAGENTGFQSLRHMAVDENYIYAVDYRSVLVYNLSDSGDIAPKRTIEGTSTGFSLPWGISIDSRYIYVADSSNGSILVFDIDDDGDVAPYKSVSGLASPMGLDHRSIPNLIELAEFTAEIFPGHVLLSWETGSEIDNAGFHIWRGEGGEYVRITDELIAAEGDEVSGASYSFEDASVRSGTFYSYRLEDIDYNGKSTFRDTAGSFVQLEKGWNMIDGSALANQPVADALDSIDGRYASVWTLTGDGWKMYDPARPEFSDMETFEAGHRCWIYMNEAGALALQ